MSAIQQEVGKDFENKIIHMADTYRRLKFAFIRKANPRMVRQGRQWTYAEAEDYDFYGSIYRNQSYPSPVYFECKTTEKPEIKVLEFGVKSAGILFKQLDTLIELQQNGDRAFILWEIRSMNNIVLKLNPKSLYSFKGKMIRLKDLVEHSNYEKIPHTIHQLDFLQLLPK